ncbi:hypothetical protein J7K43_08000, partial [Candidatus Calescamantes bacterium]|nr:hypothetical protein [Candidatus Calescamantes bacterium]
PAGSVSIPFAQENFQVNESMGWNLKNSRWKHSDFLIQPFYKVYDWYVKFIKEGVLKKGERTQ